MMMKFFHQEAINYWRNDDGVFGIIGDWLKCCCKRFTNAEATEVWLVEFCDRVIALA